MDTSFGGEVFYIWDKNTKIIFKLSRLFSFILTYIFGFMFTTKLIQGEFSIIWLLCFLIVPTIITSLTTVVCLPEIIVDMKPGQEGKIRISEAGQLSFSKTIIGTYEIIPSDEKDPYLEKRDMAIATLRAKPFISDFEDYTVIFVSSKVNIDRT